MRPPELLGRQAYHLVDQALALPPAERGQWLAQQYRGDALLQAEVELLLVATADSVIDTGGLRHFDLQRPGDLIGRQIGRFRLLEYVGGGGMGVVYRGERTDGTAQRVAVKIIRQGLRDATSRVRFDLERDSLARLEHAGIARLIDAGLTDDGLPWYVMEYVDGVPIDEFCEQQGLTIEARLELLIDVCSAVDAAHRALIVHRDIKPGNVLVSREGKAKLIDFGIARHMGPQAATDGLTRSTGTLFSAHYAAPEQVLGQEIGTTTDVFGIGALAYRLLTGQRIHASQVRGDVDYLLAVTQQDVPLPSSVAANRQLRGDLDNILCRALAREPSGRYASVGELAADFRRYLDHEPVRARAPTLGYRFAKLVRRNRSAVALGALLGFALLAGLVSFVLQSREVARQRDRATAEAARAGVEAARSRRTTEFLSAMLEAPDPRLGNKDATVASVLDAAVVKIESTLGEEPEVAASVLATIARSNQSAARYPEALRALDLGIAQLERSGDRDAERFDLLAGRSEILAAMGRVDDAIGVARTAVAGLDRVASGSTALARAQSQLALLLTDKGGAKEADALFQNALGNYRQKGIRDLGYARTLAEYAHLLNTTERMKEGELLLKEAIEIYSARYGSDHFYVDDLRTALAGIYMLIGPLEAARELNSRLLDRRRRMLGPEHPDTLWSQANLANTLLNMNRPADGLRVIEPAATALRHVLGVRHQLTLYAQSLEAEALCGTGRLREGAVKWREVDRYRAEIFEPEHYLIASARVGLAGCLLGIGNLDQAESLLLPAVAMLERTSGSGYDRTQDGYRTLGDLYERRGDAARAAQWRRKLKP